MRLSEYKMNPSEVARLFCTNPRRLISLIPLPLQVMSSKDLETLNWSEWLNFDRPTIEIIPETPGVYKMHANMKIFYIGSSNENLRHSLLDCLSDPCISKATRFSYAITELADNVRDHLLEEYRVKHNGKLPTCMEGE